MCTQNLKFVALPFHEIIGVVVPEKIGQSLDTPTLACSLFSEIFNGLLFGWTLWMYWPNLKSVALSIPKIIGGTQKIWAVPGYAHAPFSAKFLMGCCSDGLCYCAGQIWTSNFEVRSFIHSWDNSDSEILLLLCSSTPVFPTPSLSLPRISPCSPGRRLMAFGLRRAQVLG